MALFLRKQWRNKPPESYQIDWSNPLADGLVSFIDVDGDHVSGNQLILLGSVVRKSDLIYSPGNSNDCAYVNFNPLLNNISQSGATTTISFCAISTMEQYASLISIPYAAASWNYPWNSLGLYNDSTGRLLQRKGGSGRYDIASSSILMSNDGIYSCRAIVDNKGDFFAYKDYQKYTVNIVNNTSFCYTSFINNQPIVIGNESNSYYNNISVLGGLFGPQLIYSRALNLDELRSINENPYQIFQPKRNIYFSISSNVNNIVPNTQNKVPVIKRKYWNKKPSESTQIDWSNPLAEGLVSFIDAEGDHVSGNPIILKGNAKVTSSEQFYSPGSLSDSIAIKFPSALQSIKQNLTILCFTRLTALSDQWSSFFYTPYRNDTSWSMPYSSLTFSRLANNRIDVAFAVSPTDYTAWKSDDNVMYGDNIPSCYGFAKDGSSSFFFKNNVKYTSYTDYNGNHALTPDFSGPLNNGSPMVFANRSYLTPASPTTGYFGPNLIYNRKLSFDEMCLINENPYQIFQPKRNVYYSYFKPDIKYDSITTPVIIRKLWKQKPPESYQIDWSNPLSEGLVSFIDVDGDHVSGNPLQLMGNAIRQIDGKIYNPGGSNDGAYVNFNPFLFSLKTNFTILSFCKVLSINTWGHFIDIAYRSGSTWYVPYDTLALGCNADTSQLLCSYSDTSNQGIASPNSFMNVDTNITCRAISKSNTNVLWFKNMTTSSSFVYVFGSTLNTIPDFSNKRQIVIGNRSITAPGESLNAIFGPQIIYNRALTVDEISSLNENPYQIFQPMKKIIGLTISSPIKLMPNSYVFNGSKWVLTKDIWVYTKTGWKKVGNMNY